MTALTPSTLNFISIALTAGELTKYNLTASAPYYSITNVGSG